MGLKLTQGQEPHWSISLLMNNFILQGEEDFLIHTKSEKNSQQSPKTEVIVGFISFSSYHAFLKRKAWKRAAMVYRFKMLSAVEHFWLQLVYLSPKITWRWAEYKSKLLASLSVSRLDLFLFHVNAHSLLYLRHSRSVTHTFKLLTYCMHGHVWAFSFLSHSCQCCTGSW